MSKDKLKRVEIQRHSTAHVLAAAVLEMFPEAKFAIGPDIENGFYYDFELPRTLIPEDLPILEEKMSKIVEANHPFERSEISSSEAIKLFKKAKQDYKVELIEDLEKDGEKKVSLYKSGDFVDLCAGPHLDSTGEINMKAVKLRHISGAYWRGDEKRPMLQRIYGLAFENPKELRVHLANLKEAEKRDHRKLGGELDLYSFARGSAGMPGSAYWHPKGTVIFNKVIEYMRGKLNKQGYGEIRTPLILNRKLWEKSGHWDKYQENMYFATRMSKLQEIADAKKPHWGVKPMNCPGMIAGVYNNKIRSYKDFPLKYSEFGIVHRYEESGVLHGLFRARVFTQDDAHVFTTQENIDNEVKELIDMIISTYKDFGFDNFSIELSTRPEKYIGEEKNWELAEKSLTNALNDKKLKYEINKGDGAFYGPKIDFHIKDSLNRSWQLGTIQLDFAMPKNLDAKYTDQEGKEKTPIMLHRAVLGSMERFIGILTEHYAGAFPLWLAPVQVGIVPVSDQFNEFADKLNTTLRENGIRTHIDKRAESVGKKIAETIHQKYPYALVIGEKEVDGEKLTIRVRGEKEMKKMSIDDFVNYAKTLVNDKALTL